jgi:PDZ domain/C2 domain
MSGSWLGALRSRVGGWGLPGAVVVAALGVFLGGCPAIYPELSTRTRKVIEGQALDPPPPETMRWIKFVSGRVPPKTRDGRPWDQVLGSLPDPYGKLMLNGKEILRTPPQSDTLEPTWPSAPRGNFRVVPEDQLRVELWDANSLNDLPIGIREIGRVSEEHRMTKLIRSELEGGGEVVIAFEPAHAMFGLGFWFELRTSSSYVTRMLEGSPAERAGLQKGDEILRISDRLVSTMTADDVRSALNSVPSAGIQLLLKHKDGTTLTVVLREGPIYPDYAQFGSLD